MRENEAPDVRLELLRQAVASASLLPPVYAHYQPLIAELLCFFLARLTDRRRGVLLAEQAQLPAEATVGERIVRLLHRIPTLHKLGQVLARDRRWDPGFRRQLQTLESLEPRTSLGAVIRPYRRELEAARRAGVILDSAALAEGSVAVVVPFSWHGGGARKASVRGVFKFLRPGINRLLEEEFVVWQMLGERMQAASARYELPDVDYQETFQAVAELLSCEVRLDLEQEHLKEAAEDYAGMDAVIIPKLLPFCTPRLTAMERMDGVHVAEASCPTAASQEALARRLVEALVAQPVFNPRPDALFHGDAHAGNLMVSEGGRLCLLDWSLAGRLTKEDRIRFVRILLAAVTLDPASLQRALEDLAVGVGNQASLEGVVEDSLRQVRRGTIPGLAWLTGLLDVAVTRARLRFRPEFLLFRKSLATLGGVLADLFEWGSVSPVWIQDAVLLEAFVRHEVDQWPGRFLEARDATASTTHLSTADLVGWLSSGPAVVNRYWLETWRDAWRGAMRR